MLHDSRLSPNEFAPKRKPERVVRVAGLHGMHVAALVVALIVNCRWYISYILIYCSGASGAKYHVENGETGSVVNLLSADFGWHDDKFG